MGLQESMRNRRSFLRLAAGGIVAGPVVVAACGGDDEGGGADRSSSATTGSSSGPAGTNPEGGLTGTISLWAWGAGPEFDAWQERIAYFNSKYPDVQVEFEPLARNGYEEYPQLLTRIAGGNAPDVIRLLNFQPTQLVAEGSALLALDDYIAATADFDADDFFESVRQGSTVDGVTYTVPQNGEPYVLYYNVDAFESAGLEDPQALFEDGAWDEAAFIAAVDGLIAGGMRFGVAFESWNYDNICFMGGGEVLDEDLTPVIDQGASPRMLGFMAGLVADGKAPSPVVAGGANLEPFRNGDVGMYLMGPWWGPALEAEPPSFAWNVTGLPSFDGVTACKLEIDSLGISSASQNPDAAWAFVKTVTDTEGLRLWSAVGTPTRRSSLAEAGYDEIPWRKDSAAMLDVATFTPFTVAGAAIDTAATSALDPLWAGQSTAEEATRAAVDEIGEALDD